MQNRSIRFIAGFFTAYVVIVLVLYGFVAQSCQTMSAGGSSPECRGMDLASLAYGMMAHAATPFQLFLRLSGHLMFGAPLVKGALVETYGVLPAEALVATLIVLFLVCMNACLRREGVVGSFFAIAATSFLWLFFAETCYAFFSL